MSGPQHDFNERGWCRWCGGATWARIAEWYEAQGKGNQLPAEDTRSCKRPGWAIPPAARHAMPQPQAGHAACEDADTITFRLGQLRAESDVAFAAKHCAVVQGGAKSECRHCGAGERCAACTMGRGGPPICPVCWQTPSKPCPT